MNKSNKGDDGKIFLKFSIRKIKWQLTYQKKIANTKTSNEEN